MRTLAGMGDTVAALLIARRETVGVSESSSAGLVAAALLAVPGASAFFLGGAAVYTRAARESLLGIRLEDHPGMRSASEPYAALAAATIRDKLGATWGLAETGAAGPGGNRYGDAAGHSCIAVAGPVARTATLETGLPDREENMWRFTERALAELATAIRAAG